MINTEAYLDRLGYRGPQTPTADTLQQLHIAHLLRVPFENLSIHAGEPIVLDDEALFDKIVTRQRGGFCYELNGLFAALLRALGFDVALLSAAVFKGDSGFWPDFDHMTLMVTLEERWLADVGFGEGFMEPLRLNERGEQPQGPRSYRLQPDDDNLILSQREGEGAWQPQYRFSLQPYTYADFGAMCHFHQTSPESHFTQKRVCSRATPDGRVTLSGTRFITITHGERHEQELSDEAAVAEALRTHFGVVLPT